MIIQHICNIICIIGLILLLLDFHINISNSAKLYLKDEDSIYHLLRLLLLIMLLYSEITLIKN
jgi:hypothetical protein